MAAPAHLSPYGAHSASSQPLPLERPTGAFILSLLGGIFIALWGLLLTSIGIAARSATFGFFGGGIVLIGALEVTFGLLVVISGILLYTFPQHHVVFGVLVLVFSTASLVGFGGLLVGFVLGLVGGVIGIDHNPSRSAMIPVYVQPYPYYPTGYAYPPSPSFPSGSYPPPPQPLQPTPVAGERYCPVCGAGNLRLSSFCQKCGKPLPPAP